MSAWTKIRDDLLRAEIGRRLKECKGSVRRCAADLGLDRPNFYRLCKRLGVKVEAFRKKRAA